MCEHPRDVDNKTEQLADGVWRVEVGYYVNAYVLANDADGAGLTLVDTGRRAGGPRLVRSIRMLGFDPRTVTDVLLTHWHHDHSGSAARFARSSAAPRVHVGDGDAGVVDGSVRNPLEAPGAEAGRFGRAVVPRLPRPAPVPGLQVLRDGDRFQAAGGCVVVATPGHTPGHCAFWLPQRGIVLAGDAVFNVLLPTRGWSPAWSAVSRIPASLARLAGLGAGTVAPGHGPPLPAAVLDRLAG
jgi:glyoxylase-like metal-dependent hydrolase (beta-lactamase superfamily II)